MSWNGATEVFKWGVYRATADGSIELVTTMPKLGFETAITTDEYISRVVVFGLDKDDNELGRSKVIKTVGPAALIEGLDAQEVKPALFDLALTVNKSADFCVAGKLGGATQSKSFGLRRTAGCRISRGICNICRHGYDRRAG